MKQRIFFLCILLLATAGRTLGDDVRLVIPASSVEAAVKTLLDARALAFYSVSSGFGVQNFNVRLNYSSQHPVVFQFLPNNRFRLACGFTGRANINYVAGNFDVNYGGPIAIEGDLAYEGGTAQITLAGRATAVVYVDWPNIPLFILNLIAANEFAIRLPEFRLGTYALVLPNISSTYFTSTSPTLTIISNSLQLGLQSNTPVVVTVDQVRESGARLENTQVGLWGGSSFTEYTVPQIFNFPRGGTQTLRGFQGLVQEPMEKYNRWNSLPNVQNHQSFLMNGILTELTSTFKTTYNATIRAELIDVGIFGGALDFRDPWFIDLNEPPYGNRNRGLSAIPHSVSYAVNNIGINSAYNGVFLNQGWPNWAPPYYSVGAPNPNAFTIGGNDYTGYFLHWDNSNPSQVGFQSPNSQQTPVVFKQSGATATARYKGHLISSLPTATSTNSQRKYVSDRVLGEERSAICYESGNQVWLGDGFNGYVEQLVSTGTDAYSMPSLLVANGGITPFGEEEESSSETLPQIAVIYQKNGSTREVWFREKLASLSFTGNPTLLGTSTVDTRPVIGRRELDSDPRLLAVWQGASGLRFRSAPFQSGSWQWGTEGTVPGASTARFNPSLTNAPGSNNALYLTCDNGNTVYLQPFLPSNQWKGSLEEVPASVGPISYGSQVAFQLPNKVHVVWEVDPRTIELRPGSGGNLETMQYRVMYQMRNNDSTWGTAREFSYGGGTGVRRPSVAALDNGLTIVTWDDGASTYRATFTSMLKPSVAFSQSGTRATLVGAGPNASLPTAKFINTATSGAPYAVQISAETFQRGEVELPMRYARRVVAARHSEDTSAIGYVSLEIGDVIVKRTNGTLDTIPLVPEPGDLSGLDERTMLNYLRSGVIAVHQAESIYVEGTIRIRNAVPLSTGSLRLGFDIVDSRDEGVLRKVGNDFTVSSDTAIAVRTGAALSGLGNTALRLRPRLAGLRTKLSDMVYSLVHVHMIESPEESLGSTASAMQHEEPAGLPAAFALHQNYPNPFNPSTTLQYDLPKESHVSLRAYDMLGREVAVLVEGVQSGGYHSAVLDGSDFSSGVYFARFTATGERGEIKYSRISKLILMK